MNDTSKPKRPINQDRRPRLPMAAGDLVELLGEIEEAGIEVWLDGGWGVDALLGEQRREHDDVDLIASLADMPRLQECLEGRGYELVDGELPTNVVWLDSEGRQVDIHPVAFNERGDGIYRMRNGEDWVFPSWGFAGRGRVLDLRVRCLSPEAQVLCHAGYELDEDDFPGHARASRAVRRLGGLAQQFPRSVHPGSCFTLTSQPTGGEVEYTPLRRVVFVTLE